MDTQEGLVGERLKKYDSTDYTKWQHQRFDNMNPDEFHRAAIAYSKENPFHREGEK